MKKNTFKVLFLIRRNQVNKEGKCAIMIRITVDGEYERINSTLTIEPELWDSAASKAIGRSSKIAEFNKRIEDIRHVIKEHYYDILNRHGYVTAEMVKNAFTGVTAKEESLVPLYLQHLEDTKKLIGLSKADPTYKKYERMYRRVVDFMKKKYNITDIPLREIKLSFITDLEFFLRTEYKYSQNTTYKCMKFFKQVINKGIRAGLIFVDPFNGYKISCERVDRGFLSEDELAKMMAKTFGSKRLEQVRDIFIFACFTGLAYIDLANLRVDNIQKMFDGRLWIVTHRQKTNTKVTVPLLPPALKILNKYEGQFLDGQLLPIITNQKLNCYLKEIAEICEINKNLTFHLARHTFATTMTLGKGVPIESVSKMLGHTNIQTTQIYARITNDKISKDMENLAQNLGSLNF
ncbi:site-specific integrase [Bacteroides caecimuris]|jgi:integrase|uniref:site-specific integrase n=1 Tax=Bacteroides caecimuris TaxID=1796613 RepID=UPI0025931884|nr:site-specific integrase [Bacteroides caecimuris]